MSKTNKTAAELVEEVKIAADNIATCISNGEDYAGYKTELLSAVESAQDAGAEELAILVARNGF